MTVKNDEILLLKFLYWNSQNSFIYSLVTMIKKIQYKHNLQQEMVKNSKICYANYFTSTKLIYIDRIREVKTAYVSYHKKNGNKAGLVLKYSTKPTWKVQVWHNWYERPSVSHVLMAFLKPVFVFLDFGKQSGEDLSTKCHQIYSSRREDSPFPNAACA